MVGFLIFTVSGCGKKTPQAKILKHLQALADIMTENKDNCIKAAEEINQWSAQNSTELESLKVEASQVSPAKKAKLKKKYKGRMKIVKAKILATTLKCAKEPKFSEAMKSINIK